MGEAVAFEGAGHPRGHPDERSGARAERVRRGALGDGFEEAALVRRLEAGVEEVLHRGAHGGIALAQRLEGPAQRRLVPRLAVDEQPDEGIGPGDRLLRPLEDLTGQAAERLDHRPRRGASAPAHEAGGHVLAEAPGGHHDASRAREERPEAGRIAARVAQLRREGLEPREQRLLRRPRAALDLDRRRRGSLHRPQHTSAP